MSSAVGFVFPVAATGTAGAAGATGVPQYFAQKKAGRRAERKQKRAAEAQREANRVSRAGAQVVNARRRRQSIAQARIAQARNAAAQGDSVQSSSALAGVQAGITSQLGANIGGQQQQIGNQAAIQGFQQQSQDFLTAAQNDIRRGQERSAMFSAAGNTFQMGLGMAGGFGGGSTAGGGANSFASQTPGPRGPGGFR